MLKIIRWGFFGESWCLYVFHLQLGWKFHRKGIKFLEFMLPTRRVLCDFFFGCLLRNKCLKFNISYQVPKFTCSSPGKVLLRPRYVLHMQWICFFSLLMHTEKSIYRESHPDISHISTTYHKQMGIRFQYDTLEERGYKRDVSDHDIHLHFSFLL